MASKLTDQEIDALEQERKDWCLALDRTYMERAFCFPDFKAAFAFMTQIAFKAEELNHHPDWRNSYNRVDIRLSTHDVKGLSNLDDQLMAYIDRIYSTFSAE